MSRTLRAHQRCALLVAALVLGLSLSSCANRRADASPPTTTPNVVPPTLAGPVSVPQTQVELPPEQPVPEAAIPPRPQTATIVGPQPPPTLSEAPSIEVPHEPAVTETPAAPTALPQLSRLLTPEQRREYNRVISENVLAAQVNLDLLKKRPLSDGQRPAVERVRAFLTQVEEARRSDPELARSLSDRARLLAENLVRNMPR